MIYDNLDMECAINDEQCADKLCKELSLEQPGLNINVIEILISLCKFSPTGHIKVLSIFDRDKELQGYNYRFQGLVKVLISPHSSAQEKQALITLINALITSPHNISNKVSIRDEFLGLRILDHFNHIKLTHSSNDSLLSQIASFKAQMTSDEQNINFIKDIDMNSPLEVFNIILRQVAGTPQEIVLLTILQHLLLINSDQLPPPLAPVSLNKSLPVWERVSKAVITTVQDQLISPPYPVNSYSLHNCPPAPPPLPSIPALQPILPITTPLTDINHNRPVPPPPLPALYSLQPLRSSNVTLSPAANNCFIKPPAVDIFLKQQRSNYGPSDPHPYDSSPLTKTLSQTQQPSIKDRPLPQQLTPAPRAKLKTLNWIRIPLMKILSHPEGNNVWTSHRKHKDLARYYDIDFSSLEELFVSPHLDDEYDGGSTGKGGTRKSDSPMSNRYSEMKRMNEILLLEPKRNLNISIYLKQFKNGYEEVIANIEGGKGTKIGVEKLRGLLKLIPETYETEMLKGFEGDFNKLGVAEKFLKRLILIPNYQLRIEGLLLKEDFINNLDDILPALDSLIYTAQDIKNCSLLHEILLLTVYVGNFINSGGYAGNAAGIRLTSLLKISEIRGNNPKIGLIHFVAEQLNRLNIQPSRLATEIKFLEKAQKINMESLILDISSLTTKCGNLSSQLSKADGDLKNMLEDFLKYAKQEMDSIQKDLVEIERWRIILADFFCEDRATFKLEESFKIFYNFLEKLRKAEEENIIRKQIEEKRKDMKLKEKPIQKPTDLAIKNSLNTSYTERACFKNDKSKEDEEDNKSSENSSIFTEQDNDSLRSASPGCYKRRMRKHFPPSSSEDLMEFLSNSHYSNVNHSLIRTGSGSSSSSKSVANTTAPSFRESQSIVSSLHTSDKDTISLPIVVRGPLSRRLTNHHHSHGRQLSLPEHHRSRGIISISGTGGEIGSASGVGAEWVPLGGSAQRDSGFIDQNGQDDDEEEDEGGDVSRDETVVDSQSLTTEEVGEFLGRYNGSISERLLEQLVKTEQIELTEPEPLIKRAEKVFIKDKFPLNIADSKTISMGKTPEFKDFYKQVLLNKVNRDREAFSDKQSLKMANTAESKGLVPGLTKKHFQKSAEKSFFPKVSSKNVVSRTVKSDVPILSSLTSSRVGKLTTSIRPPIQLSKKTELYRSSAANINHAFELNKRDRNLKKHDTVNITYDHEIKHSLPYDRRKTERLDMLKGSKTTLKIFPVPPVIESTNAIHLKPHGRLNNRPLTNTKTGRIMSTSLNCKQHRKTISDFDSHEVVKTRVIARTGLSCPVKIKRILYK
ncbi:unnamed protein product [Gordionus sp. m RMFG-2023]